jgi:putative methionine-R-sulfoxide reductase with GAF domain
MGNDVVTRVLPAHYRTQVRTPLRKLLEKACRQLDMEHAFIGYIEEEGIVWIEPALWIGRPEFPVRVLGITEGLCGLAIRENSVVAFPLDPESKNAIILVDANTKAEIAAPLRHLDGITGVVLLHTASDTCQLDVESKVIFRKIIDKMNGEIRRVEEARNEARSKLNIIAEECRGQVPRTKRGYIAVKDWHGGLKYFSASASDNPRPFLELEEWEGLCGEVMATGMHILTDNVLQHPAYKASDPEIRSEIIYPIFDREETIGVINLESKHSDAFDDAQDVVKSAADRAQQWALQFRQPPSDHFGYVLGDYLGSIAGLLEVESRRAVDAPKGHVSEKIIHLLCGKALRTIGGIRYEWWPDIQRPPFAPQRTSAPDAPQGVLIGGFDTIDKFFTVHACVKIGGTSYGTIGIEKKDSYRAEDPHILETFCRVTAFFLQHSDRESRQRSTLRLLQRLTLKPGGGLIEEAVHSVPTIVGGDNCTLFYKTKMFDRDVLVPGPTTSKSVFHAAEDGDPWYEVDPKAGLTAWVGSKGEPLHIYDIKDEEELRKIDPDLQWKAWLSEEPKGQSRSYLACPIFQPDRTETPENVIGVLRTYRDLQSHNSGFSKEDLVMLKTIARLLSTPLHEVINASMPNSGRL